jgi:hypothetical protein
VTLRATDLKTPYQESIHHEFSITSGSELQKSADTPGDVEGRHEPVYWDTGEAKQKWDLAKDGSCSVDGLQMHQLIAIEIQVLFHAADVGII